MIDLQDRQLVHRALPEGRGEAGELLSLKRDGPHLVLEIGAGLPPD
ncbi:hypothetical protein ACOJBM_41280 [Rhizobium beringeri]